MRAQSCQGKSYNSVITSNSLTSYYLGLGNFPEILAGMARRVMSASNFPEMLADMARRAMSANNFPEMLADMARRAMSANCEMKVGGYAPP